MSDLTSPTKPTVSLRTVILARAAVAAAVIVVAVVVLGVKMNVISFIAGAATYNAVKAVWVAQRRRRNTSET